MDKEDFLSLICDVFCADSHCGECEIYTMGKGCEENLERLIKINPSYVLRSAHVKIPKFKHFSKELFDWAE